jgi:amino acid adenylation domain-containing protein
MEKYQERRIGYSFNTSEEIANLFKEFSHSHGISPAGALSILVGMLLFRYSGETHVPVRVKVGNGDFKEHNIDFEESPTVRSLLHQMRENMNNSALESTKPIGLEHDGLIEFTFPQHLVRPLMRVSDYEIASEGQNRLVLACKQNATSLCFVFHYDKSLYNDAMIVQIGGHFQNLLKSMIENADLKINELQMLSSKEINKIVYEWNSAQLEYEHKCFQELFDEQVAKNPQATALLCQNQTMSYAELNSRANGVAYHLLGMGAKPETVIGIGMGRSLDAIAGIVGVLKTGAAYCVIDPDYPVTRIKEMLKEAGLTIILTRSETAARFGLDGSQIINIEDLLNNGKNVENISRKVRMENAAYITFTSGSTGKPKGVVATHRSLAVLNNLSRFFYKEKSSEVFCLNAQLGFSSVATLLIALCCGFPIVVIPNKQEKDPRAVALAVQQHRVTNLSIMPSFLRQLFSLGDEGKELLNSIKRVALTGSEVTWDLVEPFHRMMPDAKLTAGYVSSETCAVAFGNVVDLEGKEKSERVPLGRPSRAAQVLVLDRNMNPVPIGVPGELYIGSAHLARGYIGRPAQTAEYFLPNPYGRSPGERMYRTGDVVRYRLDGEIEFWGRSDNQVKIRGYRVELEEIEAAIMSHAEIEEAAVVADKNDFTERLVAYIVRKRGAETNIPQLRQYLELRLPFYMIPSVFVVLDQLPMTENGKIDRKALPLASRNPAIPDRRHETVSDPIQKALIEIWQASIGVDVIGIHDEFLELGGDSLIAAIIVMRIRELFDVEIPLPLFFEDLTIEALAVEIARLQESKVIQ